MNIYFYFSNTILLIEKCAWQNWECWAASLWLWSFAVGQLQHPCLVLYGVNILCVSPWGAHAVTVPTFKGKVRHLARSSGFPVDLWAGFASPSPAGQRRWLLSVGGLWAYANGWVLIASIMGNTRADRINSKAERTSRKSKLGEIPEKPGKLIKCFRAGCIVGSRAWNSEGVGWGGSVAEATVTGHPSPIDLMLRDCLESSISFSEPGHLPSSLDACLLCAGLQCYANVSKPWLLTLRLWSQTVCVQISFLPLTSCVTLDTVLNLSVL